MTRFNMSFLLHNISQCLYFNREFGPKVCKPTSSSKVRQETEVNGISHYQNRSSLKFNPLLTPTFQNKKNR